MRQYRTGKDRKGLVRTEKDKYDAKGLVMTLKHK